MTKVEEAIIYSIFVSQSNCAWKDGEQQLDTLCNTPTEEIFSIIKENKEVTLKIAARNIPQFSNPRDIEEVLNIIINSCEQLGFAEIGYFLCNKGAKLGAKRKYGENHYKLAVQLGLATEYGFRATDLGYAYFSAKDSERKNRVLKKLPLRVPIIQQSLLEAESGVINMYSLLKPHLSESTIARRSPNIRSLLEWITDVSGPDMQRRVSNIVWRK